MLEIAREGNGFARRAKGFVALKWVVRVFCIKADRVEQTQQNGKWKLVGDVVGLCAIHLRGSLDSLATGVRCAVPFQRGDRLVVGYELKIP